jgi:hypothetical protein
MLFRNISEKTDNCYNLKLEAWLSPKDNIERDYKSIVRKIEKDLKQLTFRLKSALNIEEYIVDLDLRVSGISYGKKSYMKCYITLMGKNNDIDIEQYLNYLNHYFDSNEIFKISKDKR